jgi:hypothetical protein
MMMTLQEGNVYFNFYPYSNDLQKAERKRRMLTVSVSKFPHISKYIFTASFQFRFPTGTTIGLGSSRSQTRPPAYYMRKSWHKPVDSGFETSQKI